jgi:hypothetical protein
VQEMQKKETAKQSCSNIVARIAPSAFARITKVLGPFREISETFPPKSSILPEGKTASRPSGGETASRKDVRGPQDIPQVQRRLNNPPGIHNSQVFFTSFCHKNVQGNPP